MMRSARSEFSFIMSDNLSKARFGFVVVTICVTALTGLASAHSLTGSLGAATGATDFYQVTCSDDKSGPPSYLVTSIESTISAATPRISVQARFNTSASNATDPINGDGNYSPSGKVTAGGGLYNVLIYKDGAGVQNYALEYHCLTATGVHTGTTENPPAVQNQ
jgi:hypothetical protein